MRYAVAMGIFLFVLCVAVFCVAETARETVKKTPEAAVSQEGGSEDLKEIDTGEGDENPPETEYGVNQPGSMVGEDYDQNTGLRNVTESDRAGELE